MATVDIINSAIPLHTMLPGFFFACSGSGMADGHKTVMFYFT
jgi:hypothetical protein